VHTVRGEAAHRGVFLGKQIMVRPGSALPCWGARRPPPWVKARATCKQQRQEGRTLPARLRALGSEHDSMAAQTALGCTSGDTTSKIQRVWGRKYGSTHRGSTVESSLAWCGGPATARKVFAASRSRLAPTPPRRRPGAARSNGSQRTVDEAPLSPASSSPLVLPHTLPLFPSCGGKQGRGKTPMQRGRWERLGPQVVGAVKSAQGQGARRALVGWRGGCPDVAALEWLEPSL
jgi:hypothetical protein